MQKFKHCGNLRLTGYAVDSLGDIEYNVGSPGPKALKGILISFNESNVMTFGKRISNSLDRFPGVPFSINVCDSLKACRESGYKSGGRICSPIQTRRLCRVISGFFGRIFLFLVVH